MRSSRIRALSPWERNWRWLADWIWAPGFGLILVFLPLLFPDGHSPSRRWRAVGWLGGLSIGLICPVLHDTGSGPTGARAARSTSDESSKNGAAVLVDVDRGPDAAAGRARAVISPSVRFHRARGAERQQISGSPPPPP